MARCCNPNTMSSIYIRRARPGRGFIACTIIRTKPDRSRKLLTGPTARRAGMFLKHRWEWIYMGPCSPSCLRHRQQETVAGVTRGDYDGLRYAPRILQSAVWPRIKNLRGDGAGRTAARNPGFEGVHLLLLARRYLTAYFGARFCAHCRQLKVALPRDLSPCIPFREERFWRHSPLKDILFSHYLAAKSLSYDLFRSRNSAAWRTRCQDSREFLVGAASSRETWPGHGWKPLLQEMGYRRENM